MNIEDKVINQEFEEGTSLDYIEEIKIEDDQTKQTRDAVSACKVNKRYSTKSNFSLKDVTFNVVSGSIHGFVAPNGHGKTTVFNIVVGLVIPQSGIVYVDGLVVGKDNDFNKNLGYIPAEPNLPQGYKVKKYFYECGRLRDIKDSQIQKIFDNSSLKKFENVNCTNLSTGQKKLLDLLILSLYQPKILILDEPFNGLDSSFRNILFNELLEIKKSGVTILLSTHTLADLQELADYITVIKNGKIVYTGIKPENLSETYYEYFKDDIEEKEKTFTIYN